LTKATECGKLKKSPKKAKAKKQAKLSLLDGRKTNGKVPETAQNRSKSLKKHLTSKQPRDILKTRSNEGNFEQPEANRNNSPK